MSFICEPIGFIYHKYHISAPGHPTRIHYTYERYDTWFGAASIKRRYIDYVKN